MSEFKARPYLLIGSIQNYAWGTQNEKAFIPFLMGFQVEKNVPYAELWMGTHPKGPSKIVLESQQVSLAKLIEEHPHDILGERVAQKYSNKLPFLFKVLSAREALSIQAHPNKQQAEHLHSSDAQHYPDDNHKPEIAIALDNLTALVGFKQFPELITTLEQYPQISTFIGNDIIAEMKAAGQTSQETETLIIGKMFALMMRKSQTHQEELLKAIENLDQTLSLKEGLSETEEIFFELRKTYPAADSGLFSLFLLNLIHLKKGEALFLKAGLPHAYLKGNIIECMANSDNVVRAGLTPKFQDIESLLLILSHENGPVKIQKGHLENGQKVYKTPAPEFEVTHISLLKNAEMKMHIEAVQIFLITEGEISILWKNECTSFKKGQSVLIPALLKSYKIKANMNSEIYIASINNQQ